MGAVGQVGGMGAWPGGNGSAACGAGGRRWWLVRARGRSSTGGWCCWSRCTGRIGAVGGAARAIQVEAGGAVPDPHVVGGGQGGPLLGCAAAGGVRRLCPSRVGRHHGRGERTHRQQPCQDGDHGSEIGTMTGRSPCVVPSALVLRALLAELVAAVLLPQGTASSQRDDSAAAFGSTGPCCRGRSTG